MDMRKAKQAYFQHRGNAALRDIEFHFTFQEWIEWWEQHLGQDWQKKRGCRRGQYVMARYNDTGPYVLGNVKCILAEDNHIEYNLNRAPQRSPRPALDYDTVVAIFLDEGGPTYLSQKYGVTKHKVYCIKTQRYFGRITNQLR